MAILGPPAKFNSRQYFRLYGMHIICKEDACTVHGACMEIPAYYTRHMHGIHQIPILDHTILYYTILYYTVLLRMVDLSPSITLLHVYIHVP